MSQSGASCPLCATDKLMARFPEVNPASFRIAPGVSPNPPTFCCEHRHFVILRGTPTTSSQPPASIKVWVGTQGIDAQIAAEKWFGSWPADVKTYNHVALNELALVLEAMSEGISTLQRVISTIWGCGIGAMIADDVNCVTNSVPPKSQKDAPE